MTFPGLLLKTPPERNHDMWGGMLPCLNKMLPATGNVDQQHFFSS
jgi:hypothetical protein